MIGKKKDKSIRLRSARDNEKDTIQNNLKQIWTGTKPLAKLFRTNSRGYLYDTGTNKILGCDDLVFELLQYLFSMDFENSIQSFLAKHNEEKFLYAAGSIVDAVKSQNILKFKNAEENHLGLPLPAGIMRLYKEDSKGSLQFIGEDQIE
ncbi:MAG: hypothetical protein MUF15_17540, partial [Acidobacteria bacterium]|nr:hypothetical protein [Acidobacteriota bacterium]